MYHRWEWKGSWLQVNGGHITMNGVELHGTKADTATGRELLRKIGDLEGHIYSLLKQEEDAKARIDTFFRKEK